jgi:flagella basal body P-ring formation protein FlgA
VRRIGFQEYSMTSHKLSGVAFFCCLALGGQYVHAQLSDAQVGEATNQYVSQTQAWINGAMAQTQSQQNSIPSMRMEVVVGLLDSRLKLAPCNKVEPYIPTGTRLWGKSRVGLRCLDGSVRWNVFLPVTVKAYGKAWVLNTNVPAGTVLRMTDASEADVDLAEDSSPITADPSQWVGLTAARQLVSGQAIRHSSVRATSAFTAGSSVRVIAQGAGFSISTEGQALVAGILGQNVRVRMENGRVVSGLVVDQHTVRIDL